MRELLGALTEARGLAAHRTVAATAAAVALAALAWAPAAADVGVASAGPCAAPRQPAAASLLDSAPVPGPAVLRFRAESVASAAPGPAAAPPPRVGVSLSRTGCDAGSACLGVPAAPPTAPPGPTFEPPRPGDP